MQSLLVQGGRRIGMPGCMCTYCPNQNVSLTQHPSGFPASAGDQYEICGLKGAALKGRDERERASQRR
jgi:hypothetical protein